MPVVNSKMMREAIIEADKLGTFVASHCEEKSVAAGAHIITIFNETFSGNKTILLIILKIFK